jgi:hypothetical protein
MSAHVRTFDTADKPAVMRPFRLRRDGLAIVAGLALLLAGCADAPRSPVAGEPDPTDPAARVPRVDYRSTVGTYKSQRPVEPAPWGEQNERVTPAPKSGQ